MLWRLMLVLVALVLLALSARRVISLMSGRERRRVRREPPRREKPEIEDAQFTELDEDDGDEEPPRQDRG